MGKTDGRTPDHYIDPALHANNTVYDTKILWDPFVKEPATTHTPV